MIWARREFLKKTLLSAGAMAVPGWMQASSIPGGELTKLIILHTNDTHSRIEPFPDDGSRNAGLGGAARRAGLIDKIRDENDHVLLFDSGDIFQGTPYFNFFKGEPEIRLMTEMGYDATTMGNHDFDGSLENFEKQLREHANFPLIISNYDFSDTVMHNRYLPRKVFQKGDIRIGVTGAGIKLEGLVPRTLYGATRYMDPVSHATAQAKILKHDEKCDLVICLSHLGYKYEGNKVSDLDLAHNSTDIDIILGGHTHTFMNEPDIRRNVNGQPVLIHQVGWAGLRLGKIDVIFERNRKHTCVTCEGIWVR